MDLRSVASRPPKQMRRILPVVLSELLQLRLGLRGQYTLVIGLKEQTISVPAYGVAVYLDRTPSA